MTALLRTYPPPWAPGQSAQDIPPASFNSLSPGWFAVALVGTTAQRPPVPTIGQWFLDTTLGKAIFFANVGGWQDPLNPGATV